MADSNVVRPMTRVGSPHRRCPRLLAGNRLCLLIPRGFRFEGQDQKRRHDPEQRARALLRATRFAAGGLKRLAATRDRDHAIARHQRDGLVRAARRLHPRVCHAGLHAVRLPHARRHHPALRDLGRRCRKEGTLLILSGVHSQPVVALTNSGLYDELGEANICGNIDDALNRARTYLGLATEERPAFAIPDVAREMPHGERRHRSRP